MNLTVVDAFTDAAFSGNSAAVAVVERFPADDWMQLVAREMNLAETAFLAPRPDGDHDLRWFTPIAEVDLCGHATLAAGHVLGRPARFHTRSGLLTCDRRPDGTLLLDFPADPPGPVPVPAALAGPGVLSAAAGRFDLLLELDRPEAVVDYRPDLAAIAALDRRGLIVTAWGSYRGADFVSRFFGPAVGVAEDPVTGSAHCTLAEFWGGRHGREEMTGFQASPRGGSVGVRRRGNRVELQGRAVTVATTHLLVDPPG